MSSKITEGIIYILALILSDLFGYKLVPLKDKTITSTEPQVPLSTSSIVTSTLDFSKDILKIEINDGTSSLIITSSIKDIFETSSLKK
jgi:hypothetical protein